MRTGFLMMIAGFYGYIGTAFIAFLIDDFNGMKLVTVVGLFTVMLFALGTVIEVRDLRHSVVQPIDPEEVLSKYQQENNALLSLTMFMLLIVTIFIVFWIASGGF